VSAGRILVELACPPGGQHRHRHGLGAQPLQDEPVRTGAHRGEPQSVLVGALPLATLPPAPFAGRFTDRFGTPSAAIVGFATFPLRLPCVRDDDREHRPLLRDLVAAALFLDTDHLARVLPGGSGTVRSGEGDRAHARGPTAHVRYQDNTRIMQVAVRI